MPTREQLGIGLTDITQECSGGYKTWLLVDNMDTAGQLTGGQHYRPLHMQKFRSLSAAERAIREARRMVREGEADTIDDGAW